MVQVRSTPSQALNISTAAGLVIYGTGICPAHSHALGISILVAGLVVLLFECEGNQSQRHQSPQVPNEGQLKSTPGSP